MNRELMQRALEALKMVRFDGDCLQVRTMHAVKSVIGPLSAALAAPVAPAEPAEGWVIVPKRMTQEMRDVTDSEGWTWEDLLAEAGSISQEEYAAIAAEPAPPTSSPAAPTTAPE